MQIHGEEVFGPVMVLISYSDFKSVIHEVNQSKFGLQASNLILRISVLNIEYFPNFHGYQDWNNTSVRSSL